MSKEEKPMVEEIRELRGTQMFLHHVSSFPPLVDRAVDLTQESNRQCVTVILSYARYLNYRVVDIRAWEGGGPGADRISSGLTCDLDLLLNMNPREHALPSHIEGILGLSPTILLQLIRENIPDFYRMGLT